MFKELEQDVLLLCVISVFFLKLEEEYYNHLVGEFIFIIIEKLFLSIRLV